MSEDEWVYTLEELPSIEDCECYDCITRNCNACEDFNEYDGEEEL